MKWEPKNIQASILPIILLNWIMGLSVLEIPLEKARPALTFIYVFIIHSLYWFAYFYHKISEADKDIKEIQRDIFALLRCVNMFIATCSVLLGWFYYKAYKINIRRLEMLDETLESLGLSNNYRKIFINSLIKVVMWLVLICILVFFDACFLIMVFKDFVQCLRIIYLFHFPLHLNYVFDVTITSIINCLGMRFKNINLLLKRSFSENLSSMTVKKLYPKRGRNNISVISTEISPRIKERRGQLELLILVRHLHMELSKISCEVNKIYQKQMTMEMGLHFVTITGILYNLFTTLFFSNEAFTKKIKSIISMLLWCTAFAYRFLSINSTCARVSSESLKTREILYEFKNSSEDNKDDEEDDLKKEIEQFSLQLTQRPVVFTACGSSILDYTFVRRFIGTLTTFLVILIQFTPEISD